MEYPWLDEHISALQTAFAAELGAGTVTMADLLRRVLVAIYRSNGGGHHPSVISNAVSAVIRGKYADA